MMRFVDLGKQIGLGDDWWRQFAFYNTVSDRFVEFDGKQVWDSWEQFESCCDDAGLKERLKRLCPRWVFDVPQEVDPWRETI